MTREEIREKTIKALNENRHIIELEKIIVIAANDGQNKCFFEASDLAVLDKVAWYFREAGFKVCDWRYSSEVYKKKLTISW